MGATKAVQQNPQYIGQSALCYGTAACVTSDSNMQVVFEQTQTCKLCQRGGNTCAEWSEEDVEKDVLYINSYIQDPNQSALGLHKRWS